MLYLHPLLTPFTYTSIARWQVREELQYSRAMFQNLDERIKIEVRNFEDKAKGMGIHQFADFYSSSTFKAKFSLDTGRKLIVSLL